MAQLRERTFIPFYLRIYFRFIAGCAPYSLSHTHTHKQFRVSIHLMCMIQSVRATWNRRQTTGGLKLESNPQPSSCETPVTGRLNRNCVFLKLQSETAASLTQLWTDRFHWNPGGALPHGPPRGSAATQRACRSGFGQPAFRAAGFESPGLNTSISGGIPPEQVVNLQDAKIRSKRPNEQNKRNPSQDNRARNTAGGSETLESMSFFCEELDVKAEHISLLFPSHHPSRPLIGGSCLMALNKSRCGDPPLQW